MTNDQRLADIQKRISQASQEEARAEVVRENARAQKLSALAALKEEFGVGSVDEAKELRQRLTETLNDNIERIEGILDDLGA